MRRHGIERRTLLVALIPIMVMSLLLECYFIYVRLADMNEALLDRSRLMTHQLASSSEYAVFSGNLDLLRQETNSVAAQQDVSKVLVLDASGKLLMSAGGKGKEDEYAAMASKVKSAARLFENQDVLLLYEPIIPTQIRLDDLDGENSSAATAADRPLGSVIIEVSKQHLNKQKSGMLVFNVLVTLLALMVALLMALWAARGITHPILGMSRAIRRIGEGGLDTRISPQPRVHELSELATGINRMAQQLQDDRNTLQQRIDDATRELRVKKEEAENASRDKSRFLASASHDLRQPMHALGLYIEVLQRKVKTPELLGIVERIGESIAAMSGLLNSLLDISKLDAGVVSPRFCAFPIAPLLNRMARDYAPVAADKDILLRVHPVYAEVMSDPVLLERILLNLLNNALRYTPNHGRVLLACRKRGNRLRVEVRDNGGGIPPEEQQNIFREFFQLDNAGRDRGKGLGLGLAIVERLAKLLDCRLALRSAPGKGSVFAIEVPLAGSVEGAGSRQTPESPPVSAAGAENDQASLQGITVLLADDDPLVLAGTQAILASWGCKVCAAASLHQAREQFVERDFDLVVCDHRLPDGTGLELIAWVKNNVHEPVPAILISGDTAPEILQQVAAGGHHLLHKPVRPAKLRSLMLFLLAEAGERRRT